MADSGLRIADRQWRGNRVFSTATRAGGVVSGDPLERLSWVIDFEVFRGDLEVALSPSDRAGGDRRADDATLMFKILVLQTLYTLSEHETARIQRNACRGR